MHRIWRVWKAKGMFDFRCVLIQGNSQRDASYQIVNTGQITAFLQDLAEISTLPD